MCTLLLGTACASLILHARSSCQACQKGPASVPDRPLVGSLAVPLSWSDDHFEQVSDDNPSDADMYVHVSDDDE